MGSQIPRSFINDLLSRVDIVDVIEAHLPLRKAGRDYQALCPFHHEKTPSFTVSRDKQFYYCFGCGASGSAIGFLMDYAHLDFTEAVQELALRAGVQVPQGTSLGLTQPPEAGLYEILEKSARFYATQFREHPLRARAIDYLKQRGLSSEVATEFGLGYAPPGWDNLVRALGNSRESVDLLMRAGMLIRKEDSGHYDRFRDRIMFPIHDSRGRIVGFGGRVLNQDQPKYLNSPETAIFRKRQELYGLYHACKASAQLVRLFVVEGYMDVLTLVQHSIRNAVATLGTAITPEHLDRMFRMVSEVVFCFDGDEAGRRAAWRALEIALPQLKENRYVGFLFLPQGEDPDSLIHKQGPGLFEDPRRITPLSDFLFNTLCQRVNLATLDGRARLVDLAKPLLARIPKGAFQQLMWQRLAELSGLKIDQLACIVRAGEPIRPQKMSKPGTQGWHPPSLVRTALALLLREPSLAMMVDNPEVLASVELPGMSLLISVLRLIHHHPEISCGAILERWRGTEEGRHLCRLVSKELPLPATGIREEFSGAIDRLQRLGLKMRRQALLKVPLERLTAAEKDELRRLLASFTPPKRQRESVN